MTKKTFLRRWFPVLFALTCYFVFAYPVWRLAAWWGAPAGATLLASLGVWGLSVAAMRYAFNGPNMRVRYVVVHWMGVSFICATLALLAEPLYLSGLVDGRGLATAVGAAAIVISLLAVLASHHLSVKRFHIPSGKVSRPYRIAQISDVHIGSRRGGYMERIVERLNRLDPDCVVITGDLVDSSAVEFEALESLSRISARTLFCIGNHERYADLGKILDITERLGIVNLRQQHHAFEDLHFIGIDDADDPKQVETHLPAIPRAPGKFNVLLYHRPQGWEAAMAHGIDLKLSGHTHNGQIFPFNLVVKQQFNRIRGMYRKGDQRLYVSPGTGTWGPLMRLGSLNEISVFDIRPG